jgi:hypothetical protein
MVISRKILTTGHGMGCHGNWLQPLSCRKLKRNFTSTLHKSKQLLSRINIFNASIYGGKPTTVVK